MEIDFAEKAKEAFFEDNFELAVDFYSKAIDLNPNDPHLFADRAQANIKLKNFTEAIADANQAIALDPKMAKGYLRKGTACMKCGEYHTAKDALEAGAALAENDSRFTTLIKECDQHIAEETRDLTKSVTPSTATPVNVSLSKPKFRHEFYQKPDEVVVTIFAKGIAAEDVSVVFGEQILSVTINVPGEDAYHFQPRLFAKIMPQKSRYQVLSTKVEIRLVKAEVTQWTSLEYSKEITVLQKPSVSLVGSQRPAYPSSKSKAMDWDKLEAQVKKEEKEEKLDGDAGLNKLFRDIYQSGDENMRRAMNKSFVESNGTVLSTDWKEIGSKKVEGSAPEGMEVKKWEY
ncbi:hypothetical protein SLA2020_493090 [Shorea laevis]